MQLVLDCGGLVLLAKVTIIQVHTMHTSRWQVSWAVFPYCYLWITYHRQAEDHRDPKQDILFQDQYSHSKHHEDAESELALTLKSVLLLTICVLCTATMGSCIICATNPYPRSFLVMQPMTSS